MCELDLNESGKGPVAALMNIVLSLFTTVGGRDIAFSRATGYKLDDRVQVPVGERIFFIQIVQTGSGAHPASYRMDSRRSFTGGKAAGT
jgi:hypothetical protein